jgi:hypothetical protein
VTIDQWLDVSFRRSENVERACGTTVVTLEDEHRNRFVGRGATRDEAERRALERYEATMRDERELDELGDEAFAREAARAR